MIAAHRRRCVFAFDKSFDICLNMRAFIFSGVTPRDISGACRPVAKNYKFASYTAGLRPVSDVAKTRQSARNKEGGRVNIGRVRTDVQKRKS